MIPGGNIEFEYKWEQEDGTEICSEHRRPSVQLLLIR